MNRREYERQRAKLPGRKMQGSRAWLEASRAFLALPGNAICAYCRSAPATVTDHRIAHKGNARLFWDRHNWVPCCAACNTRKAIQTEGTFGRKPGEFTVKGCGPDGVPLDSNHPWRKVSIR